MDYATSQDVADRWPRPLTDDETALAAILCGDASALLDAAYPDTASRITSGALTAANATQVVAGMVKRAMILGDNEGVESESETTGPYSLSRTYARAMDSLYLTDSDRLLITGYRAAAMSVRFAC